jgi:hypothetical protein
MNRLLTLLPLLTVVACGAGADREGNQQNLGQDGGGLLSDGISGDIGDAANFQEIFLSPSNAVLFIDQCSTPATPAKQKYTAKLQNLDGTETDVTSEVELKLDDPLGTFAGPELTSVDKLPGTALGVTTVIRATARGKTGYANVTLASLRKACDKRDFFFLEPYKLTPSPSRDVLKFGTNIKQVDVAFSVDTTGSMSGAIDNLKSNLSTTIFPGLKKAIPNVAISVVDFKDISDTWVVKVLQRMTTDISKAQSAAGLLAAGGGGDEPEADICAMMHIVTGKKCSTTPEYKPTAGTYGGVEFRPGALPVVANVTDAHWHDPSDSYGLEKDLMPAFRANNVRFVGITETQYGSYYTDLEDLANYLSDYTDSNVPPSAFAGACGATGECCTGEAGASRPVGGFKKQCRLNFIIKGGTGLGDSIVRAIGALSVGSIFDVTAVPSNDPTNPDGVNAVGFIEAIRAMSEGDVKEGCPAHKAKDSNGDGKADTFLAVPVGTPVCFEVLPKTNTIVPPKEKAQFFNAYIDVLGMPGSVKLDRRTVLFLVPPTDPVAK